MPQTICWKSLSDGHPDKDKYPRVLVYREGFDGLCPQVFDVETSCLHFQPTGPDDIDNPAFGATHWTPLPIPFSVNTTFQRREAA